VHENTAGSQVFLPHFFNIKEKQFIPFHSKVLCAEKFLQELFT